MPNCSCLLRHTPGLFQKGTFCIDEETDIVFPVTPMVHAMHTSLCVSACECVHVQASVSVFLTLYLPMQVLYIYIPPYMFTKP